MWDESGNGCKWVEQTERDLAGRMNKTWDGLDVGSKLREGRKTHQVWLV